MWSQNPFALEQALSFAMKCVLVFLNLGGCRQHRFEESIVFPACFEGTAASGTD